MFRQPATRDVVNLLLERNASVWHACQFRDLDSYLTLGGVPSRQRLTTSRLPFTRFRTDAADLRNGVWDKVFLNLGDYGEAFARGWIATPNSFGPIVIQLTPLALLETTSVAVCLRSAGATDFDPDKESLAEVADVDELFQNSHTAPFPASTFVRFGDMLDGLFPGITGERHTVELSCATPEGRHGTAVRTAEPAEVRP